MGKIAIIFLLCYVVIHHDGALSCITEVCSYSLGLLSLQYGVSSDCRWRGWPPSMDGSFGYVAWAVIYNW